MLGNEVQFTENDLQQLQALTDAVLVVYNLIRDDAFIGSIATQEEKQQLIQAARVLRNEKYFLRNLRE